MKSFHFQALPYPYLRRVLAWLSMEDLLSTFGTSKTFRYASYSPLVLYIHSRDVSTRCVAVNTCLRIATDQNSMQDLVSCDLILSLLIMLQEGRHDLTLHGKILRTCSANGLRQCHKYRPSRGNTKTDPTDIIPVGSTQDLSSTAEAELLDECLRLAGITAATIKPNNKNKNHNNSATAAGADTNTNTSTNNCNDEYNMCTDEKEKDDSRILSGKPCFNIVNHTPAVYAPSMNGNILLPGIQGRPGCTVIERADNERHLMYLGTYYLEGFCESEAPKNQLGHDLLFWYAKAVISTLAASGCLANSNGTHRILILGLGAGVLPAFIQKYFPHVHVDVCEINQSVVDASINGFGLVEDSVHVYVEDCLNMVKRLARANEEYDSIICDVYGDGGMPRKLCDIYFLQHLKKLVIKRKGIVLLNCGHEMDHYTVMVNNFKWIFGSKNTQQFGHPDEENRVLVGNILNKLNLGNSNNVSIVLPSEAEWKERVENVIDSELFSLFLIQQIDEEKQMYYMTFLDQFGICANDSLSVNATKIQFATKQQDQEGKKDENK